MGGRRTRSRAFLSFAVILILSILSCFAASASQSTHEGPEIHQVTDRVPRHAGAFYRDEWDLVTTEEAFVAFMIKYQKEYRTREEYLHRLRVFARNVVRAAEHQALDASAVHGVTPFFDLTQEEFLTSFTGMARGNNSGGGGLNGGEGGGDGAPATAPELETKGLPSNFDWREKGAVTDVKIQGVCGSCWAFSTTGAIEGAYFISTGKLLNLSEQQLIDCDRMCDAVEKDACDNGCSGGLMTNAYKYLMTSGGLEEEKSYPYIGKRSSECKFQKEKVAVKVTNFTNIPLDEDQIAAYLVHHGPLAVGLNAAFMQTYIRGVSCPLICPRKWVNHGVLLVGYGEKGFSILRLGYQPYWIIKNSWGKHWGEDGYYRLCRGHAICGINTMVSAVTATP